MFDEEMRSTDLRGGVANGSSCGRSFCFAVHYVCIWTDGYSAAVVELGGLICWNFSAVNRGAGSLNEKTGFRSGNLKKIFSFDWN